MTANDGVWNPGTLRRAPGGYDAFYPADLPVTLDYPESTVNLLTEATAAVHRLAGVSRLLPTADILIGPYVRLEAVLSSRIEGTQATVGDLLLLEAGGEVEGREDVQEVLNYVDALRHAQDRLATLPLSSRLIKETHAILMRGVRGEHALPGEFRTTQNWIGPPGTLLADAIFVPPPPDEVPGAIGALEHFIHGRDLPNLVAVALAHYQFETIHPFVDGNGRIGRLLIPLMLIDRGVLSIPVLYLSAYFERDRAEYYARLDETRFGGSPFAWLDYFLRGVAPYARDAEERTVALVDLQRDLRVGLQEGGATLTTIRLAERLIDRPYVTAPQVARMLDVTFPTAQAAIEALQELGHLREITGRARNRIYQAASIMAAVYDAPAPT
ncbi:MAG: Fic family protein [Actinobacteria bacterium]|nr:Fic family protein [Actinomycetota bacterium]